MLSAADNELLTRTGPRTAMGDLFRRFWMPALLSQAEVMVQRFGDPVGRVGRDPSGAQASRATYSSPRSSLSR